MRSKSTLHLLALAMLAAAICRVAMALNSDEIPRGTSKESPDSTTCGLMSMPDPVLAECTETIPTDIPNHIGYWKNNETGVSFRVEQCGDRYVVSGKGSSDLFYIHDFLHADGTLDNGVMDFSAFVLPQCRPVSALGIFNGTCMEMRIPAGNTSILAANRCLLDDGTLEFFNLQIGAPLVMTKLPTSTMAPTMSPTSTGETNPTSSSGKVNGRGLLNRIFLLFVAWLL